jgi:hypothetical protein
MSVLYLLERFRLPILNEFMLLITQLGEETAFLAVALIVGLILVGVNDGWGKENNIMKKVSYGMPELIANINRNTVVATAGEYTLTNAQLQVLYTLQVLDFVSLYGNYISMSGVDPTQPLSKQVYDKVTGLTWEKHFLQEALMAWMEYCAVATQAEKAGYVIPQEFVDHFRLKQHVFEFQLPYRLMHGCIP